MSGTTGPCEAAVVDAHKERGFCVLFVAVELIPDAGLQLGLIVKLTSLNRKAACAAKVFVFILNILHIEEFILDLVIRLAAELPKDENEHELRNEVEVSKYRVAYIDRCCRDQREGVQDVANQVLYGSNQVQSKGPHMQHHFLRVEVFFRILDNEVGADAAKSIEEHPARPNFEGQIQKE